MSLARKARRRAKAHIRRGLKDARKHVFIGEVEDGSDYRAHPEGGIIVIHPSHPPRWFKPDGTNEEIKP